MPMAVTRREMWRGRALKPASILPPWALDFEGFSNHCDGCGACVPACPENILRVDESKFASADFSQGCCDFCGACETACPTGALNKKVQPPWQHKAHVSAKCISTQGIVCRLCEEACEPRAIQFKLMLEGRSIPLIDINQCTGCGGCLSVCPANAVTMEIINNEETQT